MNALQDLLTEAKTFVQGAGDIALTGQDYVNKLTGQVLPQPGPVLPGSQAQPAQGAPTSAGGLPPWAVPVGLGLVGLVALAFIFGGRKR